MNVKQKMAVAVSIVTLMSFAGAAHAQPAPFDVDENGDDAPILPPPSRDGRGILDPSFPLRPIETIQDPSRLNSATDLA
jgi:hypothetical protein